MSTGKGADVSVGGQRISSSGSGGLAAVAALGLAVTATIGLMQKAMDAARDAKERAEIEKRKREISDLQSELEDGRRAAERFSENARTWRLEARCKVLNARLDRVGERATAAGLNPARVQPARPASKDAGSAALAAEVSRLEQTLQQEEAALRLAITKAVEEHSANQGVFNAIDRLAALPAPLLETPSDLVGYFEESESLQRNKRNTAALIALRESLQRALTTLPERVPQATLDDIGQRVAAFAEAADESSAQTAHRRVIELIEQAQTEARAIEPLRTRLEEARKRAADLVYSQLPESDQRQLADDDSIPDTTEMAALEARLRQAKADDAARIFDQQQRLAMAATLDALQNLGYETSVVDEATWFKNGSMFISRPEWGGYVVRLTPRQGTIVLFAGRYVDDASLQTAEEAITPEMEAFYSDKIDDWCTVHLPRLVAALKHRNIGLDIRELEEDVHEIQPVAREEIGDAMASRIETRVDDKERPGGTKPKSRTA